MVVFNCIFFCFSGYHSIDYTLQSKLLGFRKPTLVKSVSGDEALKKGTKILAETLVYGISVSILIYEYRKSQIKENYRTEEMVQLQQEIRLFKKNTKAEIKCMRKQMVKNEKTVLREVGRNDRPSVCLFVFLCVRSILLHFFLFYRSLYK